MRNTTTTTTTNCQYHYHTTTNYQYHYHRSGLDIHYHYQDHYQLPIPLPSNDFQMATMYEHPLENTHTHFEKLMTNLCQNNAKQKTKIAGLQYFALAPATYI